MVGIQKIPAKNGWSMRRRISVAAALRCGVAALLSASFAAHSGPASAQSGITLDSQYTAFLDNGCNALFGGAPMAGDASQALTNLCTATAGASSGAGAGGATGVSQGSGTVVAQERAVRRRMEEARENQQGSRSPQLAAAAQPNLLAQGLFSKGGLSVFISGDYESKNRDVTALEDGYDSDLGSVTAGADYLLGTKGVVGVALNYQNLNGDFDGGGDFETMSYGVALYGSYFPRENLFADLVFGYARKDYDVNRVVAFNQGGAPIIAPTPITSNTDGNEFSLRGLVGYDVPMQRFTVGPRVGFNYVYTDIDGFTEKGSTGMELMFDDRSRTSFQSTLGVQASAAFSTGFGVLSPQVNLDWIHEFEDDQQSIDVQFAGDLRANATKFVFNSEDPDRDFFQFRLGLVAVLPQGIQPFIEYRQIFGHSFFDTYGGSIGVRLEL